METSLGTVATPWLVDRASPPPGLVLMHDGRLTSATGINLELERLDLGGDSCCLHDPRDDRAIWVENAFDAEGLGLDF